MWSADAFAAVRYPLVGTADAFCSCKMLFVHIMFFFGFTEKDIMLLDTPHMIERYRRALFRLVAGLFVMAGLEPGTGGVETLPRRVRSAILRVLRQAESATRRLAVVKARELEVPVYVVRSTGRKSVAKGLGKAEGEKESQARIPRFTLIDPRVFLEELHPNLKPRRSKAQRKRESEPRLLFRFCDFDGAACEAWSEPAPELSPDDPMTAKHICRRMQALHHALSNLPKQAQRLVREMAKRAAAPPGPGRVPPLRYGFPPGYRKKPIHVVDTILRECHLLAMRESVPPERK